MNLVLKVVGPDMRTRGGFLWPESGPVEAPDWNPEPECGGGLHGWLEGEGDYVHDLNHPTAHKWLVVEVEVQDVIHLRNKVKFRRGTVVHCGTKETAVRYLIDRGAVNENSNPGMVCLTPDQCALVARRAADRAAQYAAERTTPEAAVCAKYAAWEADYVNRSDGWRATIYAAAAYNWAWQIGGSGEREAHRRDKLRVLGVLPEEV